MRAAGAFGDSVDEDGARAALAFAAAVFGAGQVELVAEDGEQGPLRVRVDLAKDAVFTFICLILAIKIPFWREIFEDVF